MSPALWSILARAMERCRTSWDGSDIARSSLAVATSPRSSITMDALTEGMQSRTLSLDTTTLSVSGVASAPRCSISDTSRADPTDPSRPFMSSRTDCGPPLMAEKRPSGPPPFKRFQLRISNWFWKTGRPDMVGVSAGV